MNRGSLILINTAKDLLKQDGCEILGRFFLALIAQATQERAALPEERRRATFLYIDEAQDYFDEGMEQLLNQARKYRVGLILARQNLGQFEPRLQAAVMASTAIKLERFQPDWKRFNSNFASNFIDLTSLRYFQSA